MVYNQGEQLVILDEFVLDVSEFISHHPGGRFVLQHCIGRDISKYFYGGYSLDGNSERGMPYPGHMHSNIARIVANDLIIAYYEKDVEKTSTICRVMEDKKFNVNSDVATIYLQSVDKKPVPNFKKFYHGFELLTKHFWVRSLQQRNVIRHYTICNTMNPELYRAYVLALDEESGQNFDPNLLDQSN